MEPMLLAYTCSRKYLLLSNLAEKLKVLGHGVHAVWRGVQSFRFGGKDRRQFRNIATQEALHEFLH